MTAEDTLSSYAELPIETVMRQDVWIPLLLLVTTGTFTRALLVTARKLPPTCARCGLKLERSRLGESICRCGS